MDNMLDWSAIRVLSSLRPLGFWMLQYVGASSLVSPWFARRGFAIFIRFSETSVFGEASRVTTHPWRPRMTHYRSPAPTQLPLPLVPAPLLTEPEYRSIVTALAQVLLTATKTDPGGRSDE
jgi:hypothetical protein